MKRTVMAFFLVVVGISLLACLVFIQPASANQIAPYNRGYHLEHARWQIAGESSGPGYHLRIPGSPSLQGSGCCCTHLPCVEKP